MAWIVYYEITNTFYMSAGTCDKMLLLWNPNMVWLMEMWENILLPLNLKSMSHKMLWLLLFKRSILMKCQCLELLLISLHISEFTIIFYLCCTIWLVSYLRWEILLDLYLLLMKHLWSWKIYGKNTSISEFICKGTQNMPTGNKSFHKRQLYMNIFFIQHSIYNTHVSYM